MGKTLRKSADDLTTERREKKAKRKGKKGTATQVPETNLFNRIKEDKRDAAREEREERENFQMAMQFGQDVNRTLHNMLDAVSNKGLVTFTRDDDEVHNQAMRELVGWYHNTPQAQAKYGLQMTADGFTLARVRQAAA